MEERIAIGPARQELSCLSKSLVGTSIDATNMVKRFRALVERAGLPAMRYHDLRHSCASLLLVQGVEMRSIMEILGHSQMSTTSDLYAHVLPALKQRAADQMEAVLTGS